MRYILIALLSLFVGMANAGTICYKDTELRCFRGKVDLETIVDLVGHGEALESNYRIVVDRKADRATIVFTDPEKLQERMKNIQAQCLPKEAKDIIIMRLKDR